MDSSKLNSQREFYVFFTEAVPRRRDTKRVSGALALIHFAVIKPTEAMYLLPQSERSPL